MASESTSAFDLLRGIQRRARQVPATTSNTSDKEYADACDPSANADGRLKHAFSYYSAGQEDRASSAITHMFSHCSVQEVVESLELLSGEMLDVSDADAECWRGVDSAVSSRHLLFDKARDTYQWLSFLERCGVWAGLNGAAGSLRIRQRVCEVCERVAATSRLRELDDCAPRVFQVAIMRTVRENASVYSAKGHHENGENANEANKYYSKVSACEHVLAGIAEYPRTLPLGSSDVIDAVLFANAAVSAFMEAALERRSQVIAAFPSLLPLPSAPSQATCMPAATALPRAVGSDWLLSDCVQRALEDLRLVNLEVIPSGKTIEALPLLAAQGQRVAESLNDLCRTTLRVAHASIGDLHNSTMMKLTRPVIQHMAEAEETATHASGPQRTLTLAEEFEDVEAFVVLAAKHDLARLDEHLGNSTHFRSQAMTYFLRHPELRPLFFRTNQRLEIPRAEVEELMAPFPDLRWILDVHGLGSQTSESSWLHALKKVGSHASDSARGETRSSAKRDAFAALASIVRRALGEDAEPPSDVAEIACLGRIQRLCARYSVHNCKAPSIIDQAPMSAEELLGNLAACVRIALPALRAERGESNLLGDAAQLVLIIERRLEAQLVDLGTLIPAQPGCPEDSPAGLARYLQQLWAEVVLAEEAAWREVQHAHEGNRRDAAIESLGYTRMLRWCAEVGRPMPKSAAVGPLGVAFATVQPLAPVLRLATCIRNPLPTAGATAGCGMEISLASGDIFGVPSAVIG